MFSRKKQLLRAISLILCLLLITVYSFLDSGSIVSTLVSNTRFDEPDQQPGTGTFTTSSGVYITRGYSLIIPGIVTTSICFNSNTSKDSAGISRGDTDGGPLWGDLPYSAGAGRFQVQVMAGNRREAWGSIYINKVSGGYAWYNYKILLNPEYFNPDAPVLGRSLLDNAFIEATDKAALKTWLANGGGTGWINAIISVRGSGGTQASMYTSRLWSGGSGNYVRPNQIFSNKQRIYDNTNLDALSNILDHYFDNSYTFPSFPELQRGPSVNTDSVSSITASSASVSGTLTDAGLPNVSERGHVWSTTANPTTANSRTNLGGTSSTGSFSSGITGLSSGTTYHVRAYASNSVGTVYGADVTFTTCKNPAVTTGSVTNITGPTADVGGNVTDLGIPNVSQYGHVWSTSSGPTTANSKTSLGAKSATGVYTSTLTGLTAGITYYIRAYATNDAGTVYGSEVSFLAGRAPAVTTGSVTNITGPTADVGGNVTDLGIPNVSQYGHVWSTSSGPTITNSKTTLGAKSSTGTYTSTITGLTAGLTYYVRAYAQNSAGVVYGAEVSFLAGRAPSVTTGAASNVLGVTATIAGTVVDVGLPNITQYGHVWGTSVNPTTANSKTTLGSKSTTGAFSSNLTGLSGGTTYHVRAYATNPCGTVYGNDITFTTIYNPIITLTTPTNNSTFYYGVNGTTNTFSPISVTATGTYITQIRALINGSVYLIPNPKTNPNAYTVPLSYSSTFTPSASGTYTAKAQGLNTGFGWTDSNVNTFYVKPSSPTLTLATPSNNAYYYIGDSIQIAGSGTNCHHITAFINGAAYTTSYSNTYNDTFTPTAAGDYTIYLAGRNTANATDFGSELFTTTPITIHVRNPYIPTNPSTTGFRIFSVRDLAWKDKYIDPATKAYTSSTPLSQFPIWNFNSHYIKNGYAVDFKLNSYDISASKQIEKVKVDVSFFTTDLYGTNRTNTDEVYIKTSSGLVKIGAPGALKHKTFTIDRDVDTYANRSISGNYFSKYARSLGSNNIEWGWSYYLPPVVVLNPPSQNVLLGVNFTITAYGRDGTPYEYTKTTFPAYRGGAVWGNGISGAQIGDVFLYDPNHSLLDDIGNSATH